VNLKFVAREPPATEEQVASLEERLGISLPSDYRAFLLAEGGGAGVAIDGNRDVVFPLAWSGQKWAQGLDEAMMDHFYSLDPKSRLTLDAALEMFIEWRRIPADFLPIGYDPGSNQVLLGIRGERRGKIFFWMKEFEAADDSPEPRYDNIAFVAESFTDFIESLRPMSPQC
jgi:hypothetical protein